MANQIVIGAGFGDEGKGLMTDYYAAQMKGPKVVVRYGSSGQCTHTVVTPDKQRHIFKHFGAGSFTRADTYFAQKVVIHPQQFHDEYRELLDIGIYAPLVITHPG